MERKVSGIMKTVVRGYPNCELFLARFGVPKNWC